MQSLFLLKELNFDSLLSLNMTLHSTCFVKNKRKLYLCSMSKQASGGLNLKRMSLQCTILKTCPLFWYSPNLEKIYLNYEFWLACLFSKLEPGIIIMLDFLQGRLVVVQWHLCIFLLINCFFIYNNNLSLRVWFYLFEINLFLSSTRLWTLDSRDDVLCLCVSKVSVYSTWHVENTHKFDGLMDEFN